MKACIVKAKETKENTVVDKIATSLIKPNIKKGIAHSKQLVLRLPTDW